MSPLSQSPYLVWASFAFGTIFFEFAPPKNPDDRRMVDSLMVVYGVRDIFMGAAIWAGALNGHMSTVGWTLLAAGAVATADGAVCKSHGKGEWGHWSYAPMVVATGAMLLGVAD
ncbi:hypothetical protein B0H15DRAFT_828583 [Mycena belliarum]|uniref:Uncharacterized protein n=1 Tax=Mycena belliarum TaxID=1033014 RepID=A0AAD6UFD6_9AGAR|nr:hypothetical protein B0H15DRAFT_828583 [Mycena belliae]